MNFIKRIISRIKFKHTGINLNDLHTMVDMTKLMEKWNIKGTTLTVADLRNLNETNNKFTT